MQVNVSDIPPGRYGCDYCGRHYGTRSHLRRHMKLVHFPSEDKTAYFEQLFLEAHKKTKQIDLPAIALTAHSQASTSQTTASQGTTTASQLIYHHRYGPAVKDKRYELRKTSTIELTPD